MHRLLIVALPVVVVSALACSGSDDEDPTPTATPLPATSTPLPEVTATAVRTPPGPPTAGQPTGGVPRTTWLIDAGTSEIVTTIVEASVSAQFGPGGETVRLARDGSTLEIDLEGNEVGVVPQAQQCRFEAEGELIEGRWHPTLECSTLPAGGYPFGHPFLSPDGVWFTYTVLEGDPLATPAVFPPVSAMWALNFDTGERRLLQPGMQDCGGCDGRFGPTWSPSGRYYAYAESGGEYRVFLTDFETNTTRHIANGDQLGDQPQWAPGRDTVLYRSPSDTVVVEDLATGTRDELGNLPWPARFDPRGEYIYAPAIGPHRQRPSAGSTTIVSASSFEIVAELPGMPEYLNLWLDMNAVVAAPEVVAAMTMAPGCDGIVVYGDGVELTCIEGGQGATISPDGSTVALSRVTSAPATGHAEFEIVLVDVATGGETVVAEDARSVEPPFIAWNEASTHLLVSWPHYGGL